MSSDLAVSAVNISKRFSNPFPLQKSTREIFSEYSLSLARGKVIAILGPSGCGKSSFLRMCAGLDNPTSGEVLVFGAKPLLQTRSGKISVISSENTLLPWRNSLNNVALPLDLLGFDRKEKFQRSNQLLHAVRLDESTWYRKPHQLSEGQRQRLRLAQALVSNPDLILLDEPFSNVDEGLRRVLIKMVLQHLAGSSDRSAIIVTHHTYEAAAMADEIFIISGQPASNVFQMVPASPATNRTRQEIDDIVDELSKQLVALVDLSPPR